jgi:transposase
MRGMKLFSPKVFYAFSLESRVPSDHLLRRLAAVLDLRFVEQKTRGLYGANGHVSVDPVVIVKMLLLGYLYHVPSIRELMRQIEDRLSFRWFLGYDIDEPIPDHSVISKAIKRFGPALFEELFTRTVQQCGDAGLIGGDLVHVDATLIQANASGDSIQPVERFAPQQTAQAFVGEVERAAQEEPPEGEPPPADRAVVNHTFQSTTDPDAAIISRDGGKRMLAYKDHRVVDDQCGIILETKATSARVAEGTQLSPLIEAVVQRGLHPRAVAGDKGYGYATNFRKLWEWRISAHLSRIRSPRYPNVFGKEQFVYRETLDAYQCPAGQLLPARNRQRRQGFRVYQASAAVCASCDLRSQCITGKTARTIQRHEDEGYLARIRPGPISKRFALRRRKTVIEGSFAEAKERRAHRRARWRGLVKMQVQCHLVAAVQNLVKLAKTTLRKAKSLQQPTAVVSKNRICLGRPSR